MMKLNLKEKKKHKKHKQFEKALIVVIQSAPLYIFDKDKIKTVITVLKMIIAGYRVLREVLKKLHFY